MTAESECVGQGNINFAFLCFIEREIKVVVDVLVVVTFFVVDSRRNNAVLNGKDACNRFYAPAAPSK